MVSSVISCPFCGDTASVIKHGVNRGGSARCQCKVCDKTFTPKPNSRRVTPEKEARILALLAERLSIDAIARLEKVSKTTIYKALRKKDTPSV